MGWMALAFLLLMIYLAATGRLDNVWSAMLGTTAGS